MSPRAAAMTVTPAGLRIGVAHQLPPTGVDWDARRLQAALLEPRTAQPLSLAARLWSAIWRWL